jgi:uncharacterized protein (DUF4415 family)
MSKPSSSKAPRTDWSRVKAMKDKDIKLTSDHPEADVKHIVRGILRQGLKPVPSKASISLRVDADVLEWFKAQGAGYQTRINPYCARSRTLRSICLQAYANDVALLEREVHHDQENQTGPGFTG